MTLSELDLTHLRSAVALAGNALDEGDQPFGSLLVDGAGHVLFEDRNRVAGGDHTQHPEFATARWSAAHQTPEQRAASTVYTSGEHCPMCAAAHGWVGLGRIVYAASTEQLTGWLHEWGVAPGPVAPLPIHDVVPSANVAGPAAELSDSIRTLHRALQFSPKEKSDEPKSVATFDLERYLGLWYEIGRLPLKFEGQDDTDVTAEYSLHEDGSVQVDNRSVAADGTTTQALGKAVPNVGHAGQLRVTFLPSGLRWIPFTQADYWVLKLDADYQVALVGTPDRKHMWLLARTPQLDHATEEEFLIEAVRQGFDLREWIRPVHGVQ